SSSVGAARGLVVDGATSIKCRSKHGAPTELAFTLTGVLAINMALLAELITGFLTHRCSQLEKTSRSFKFSRASAPCGQARWQAGPPGCSTQRSHLVALRMGFISLSARK